MTELEDVERELESLVPGLEKGMVMIDALKLIIAEIKRLKAALK